MLKIVLVASLLTFSAMAEQPLEQTELEARCDLALSLCAVVIEEQNEHIRQLQLQVQETHDQLANSEPKPLLPGWAWAAIGVAIGSSVGYAISK